jgi:plastocyanin
MRIRHFGVALVAVAVAVAVLALPATSKLAAPGWNVPVKITNKSCVLGYKSVSHQYTRIVFGIFNNGTVAHGFDISAKYKSGLIKPHQEKTLVATFTSKGSYAYACVAAHSTVKRGVFVIR